MTEKHAKILISGKSGQESPIGTGFAAYAIGLEGGLKSALRKANFPA